jgi:predicted nucleotidyltransferase
VQTELPRLPDEAQALVAARAIDRERATKKLEEVLRVATTGLGEARLIRTISVLGSYARGAPRVGDIDLVIEIDDERDEHQARLDDYDAIISGRRPDAALLKQLKCSGGSMVNAVVGRRYRELRIPVAPEQWAPGLGDTYELAEPPRMGHVVTGQELAGPSVLLFVRGDPTEVALGRLYAIAEDPAASRFERTTGVPLLDPLGDWIGVETQYKLAHLVASGGLGLRAVVLRAVDAAPASIQAFERGRYRDAPVAGGKSRRTAVLSAVDFLQGERVAPGRIRVRSDALGRAKGRRDVLVDWGSMALFRADDLLTLNKYKRLLIVLRAHCQGPWVALDCWSQDRKVLEREGRRSSRELAEIVSGRSSET